MNRKNLFISLTILMGLLLFVSCEDDVIPGEEQKRHDKLIQAFIEKEGLEILSEYPENGVFGEKQFVRLLENQCYLHVIDSGNGNRAVRNQTEILMRCRAIDLLRGDALVLDAESPIKFTFGKAYATSMGLVWTAEGLIIDHIPLEPNDPMFLFLSDGVESALNYVGENAKVKMIVPAMFINSLTSWSCSYRIVGSWYQRGGDDWFPLYYNELMFEFVSSD